MVFKELNADDKDVGERENDIKKGLLNLTVNTTDQDRKFHSTKNVYLSRHRQLKKKSLLNNSNQ